MKIVVYIDTFFIINYIVDSFILWGLCILLRRKVSWVRIALAALLGALGACLVLFANLYGVKDYGLPGYLFITVLMVKIAFRSKGFRNNLKYVILLLLASALLSGLLQVVKSSRYIKDVFRFLWGKDTFSASELLFILLIAGVILFLKRDTWYRISDETQTVLTVDIFHGGKKWSTLGLYDTGNQLRDPFTGEDVILADAAGIYTLLEEGMVEAIEGYPESGDICYQKEIRMIPCHAVGRSVILQAIRLDEVHIYRGSRIEKKEKVLCALYKGTLWKKGEVKVILHQ